VGNLALVVLTQSGFEIKQATCYGTRPDPKSVIKQKHKCKKLQFINTNVNGYIVSYISKTAEIKGDITQQHIDMWRCVAG